MLCTHSNFNLQLLYDFKNVAKLFKRSKELSYGFFRVLIKTLIFTS